MFHNTETMKKLNSLKFQECFMKSVKVPLFKTRTETIDKLLWNAKKKPLNINRKSIKNQSKSLFLELRI